ncbi:hypothetical protein FBALC1_16932 [Flavobacteriales bacterium ALC-1]|nr:hypothetical protein FBALC1_16932 [Flavobacteriales bacterium ALC-1]
MKHLKSILVIIAFVLQTNNSQAQEKKLANSILWKVEHKDIEKPSYLLGTLHIMCEDDFIIKDKVKTILNTTDALVLEINMSDPEELKVMQESMAKSKKISEELSKEQIQKIDPLFKKTLGVSVEQFDDYGLSVAYSLMFAKMLPCSNLKYMEMELQKFAQKNNTPIKALEKVQEQMDVVSKALTPDFIYEQMLIFDAYKTDFNKAIQAYNQEDIIATKALIMKKEYTNENTEKYMVNARNKNWVDKIPKMMQENSNLFAFGTAHLSGENGVINLLKQKGFTVTAVYQ